MLDVRLLLSLVLLLLTVEGAPLTHGFSLLSPWLARIGGSAVPANEGHGINSVDNGMGGCDETAIINWDGDPVVVVIEGVVVFIIVLLMILGAVTPDDDMLVVLDDNVITVVVTGVVVVTTTKSGGCVGKGY